MVDEDRHDTHLQVMHNIEEKIEQLIKDPFLNDLTHDISLEEVKSRLAVEQGRAITIHIKRFDNESISVIVLQGATVNDLMKAFERELIRQFKRSDKTTIISWKYVWRTYCFSYSHQKLLNRRAKLASYGISNNSEVTFLKKLKQKNKLKRADPKLLQKRSFRPHN